MLQDDFSTKTGYNRSCHDGITPDIERQIALCSDVLDQDRFLWSVSLSETSFKNLLKKMVIKDLMH